MQRISKDTPSAYLGVKGDFFSEILYSLRSEVNFTDYVNINMNIKNYNDLRDRKAIMRRKRQKFGPFNKLKNSIKMS